MESEPAEVGVPLAPDGAEQRFDILYKRVGGISKAAELAGVGLQALAKWRDGRARPPFWPVARLAAEAKVSLRWFATGEGPMEEEDRRPAASGRLNQSVDLFRLVDAFDQARDRLGRAIDSKTDVYKLMEAMVLYYDALTASAELMRAHRDAAHAPDAEPPAFTPKGPMPGMG